MTHGGYILVGYLSTAGAVGLYVVRLLLRGRALGRQLPPEARRWM